MKFKIEQIETEKGYTGKYVITRRGFLWTKEYFEGKTWKDSGRPCWTEKLYSAEKYYTIEEAEEDLRIFIIDRYKNKKTVAVKEYTVK